MSKCLKEHLLALEIQLNSEKKTYILLNLELGKQNIKPMSFSSKAKQACLTLRSKLLDLNMLLAGNPNSPEKEGFVNKVSKFGEATSSKDFKGMISLT